MDDAVEALTKLAQELTDRVDELEKENADLKGKLDAQVKVASVQPAPAPSVSEQAVDATLEKLVKAGALSEDQVPESRSVLMRDMDAPHRMLQHFLDAQIQSKTASEDSEDLLAGGKLVGDTQVRRDAQAECLDRMIRILHM